MYPRGNHWAVGHLMGKKSLHEANRDSDYLSPRSKPAGVTVLEHLMEALMQPKNQKQMIPQTADSLLRLHSSWRDEDREKYLGKMKDLLLLALRLQDNNSTAVQDESLFKKSSLST
ncbi:gastrin-releasing peptide isoform X2 [Embiotoca jacksoni]